jgi:hypothetical protein
MSDFIPAFPSHYIARHHDAPILRVPAAKLTDDEIEFQSDIKYMRELVDAIIDTVLDQRFGR